MRNLIATAGILAVLGVGLFLLRGAPIAIPGTSLSFGGNVATPTAITASAPYTGDPISKEYRNEKYRFSLSMPENFRVQEIPSDDDDGTAIVLQNEKGEGIQIYIRPDPDDNTILAVSDIRVSIPDMQVVEEQDVEIGVKNKGVAFKSDNEAFGGASREVWFYFRGHLYQISTYARLDSLLQAMFGTWKFN